MLSLIILAVAVCFEVDLNSVKTEPNLEKRSELALDVADNSLTAARDAYQAGNEPKMLAALDDVGASVELAYQSLEDSGKEARRSKYFKKAEQRTGELVRRIDGFRDTVGIDDRPPVEKARDRVVDVHDNLLKEIMSKKK